MPDTAQLIENDVLARNLEGPIDKVDPSEAALFEHNVHHEVFRRLRREDPVHFLPDSAFGPYWSITKFQDIVTVDSNHKVFSSQPSIVIGDPTDNFQPPMFIAMDQPKHDVQRRAAQPAVAPTQLSELEALIRERVCTILDSLPVGEEFNWVEKVSVELTTQMLATLFDFPFEDRHKLPFWSDVATTSDAVGVVGADMEWRMKHLTECLEYFSRLWVERANQPQKFDFISLLAHSEDTKHMIDEPMELLGNLMLLIVGGNDTTRNSISGGVYFLNKFPGEYEKLKANPELIPNMVSEIIRYQTPLAHMRRIALEDFELGGKTIKKGDKVVMWYASGNRDEEVIENADEFRIDRERARHHVSFGFGIHRCMGNRVAEMQLRILWEEILKRFDHLEVVSEPERVQSNFVTGYVNLPVVLHAKA
ncbi:MAG TPA: cytochrome P450 [Henriciella marina]|uniref:cytochrome P450 n=1 Tax=Henriciella sp. TaxID=1968823 RepID=UPI0017CB2CF1|nr:cytochrome P450 [Henriciella sp.]HIG21145.1 cytochrome P450 [Henriciella sp.]HIK64330.1 cytochrome P450 [Henriciella marina]